MADAFIGWQLFTVAFPKADRKGVEILLVLFGMRSLYGSISFPFYTLHGIYAGSGRVARNVFVIFIVGSRGYKKRCFIGVADNDFIVFNAHIASFCLHLQIAFTSQSAVSNDE